MHPVNLPAPIATRPVQRRRGLTLIEILVSLAIFGVVMTAVTRQLIESVSVTLKTSRLLEYSRNGRNLIERLNADVRSAQAMLVYPEFNDRSTEVVTESYGNHLVLQQIAATGTISRTIGYYALPIGSTGTYRLYRYESNGSSLPDVASSGTHAVVISTLVLPAGKKFFQNWSDRGVSIRGQYGTAPGAPTNKLNYIQCTLTTRS